MVFQLQFALFEAAQLQLVVVTVKYQQVYDRIEVAMFHVELDQSALDFLIICHSVWCSQRFYFNEAEVWDRKRRTIHYNQ